MKTYKTWEVYKMLTENPNLKFKDQAGYYLVIEDDFFTLKDVDNYEVDYVANGINDIWTLVQEPLSFMEAVESGKKIKANHGLLKGSVLSSCYNPINVFMSRVANLYNKEDVKKILTESEFYIEE